MTSRLFKASIALIVVGVALLVILQVLYVPKIEALQKDSLNFSRNWPNNTHSNPPTLEDYGLDLTMMLLVIIFGNIAYILLLLGAAFLVILLIERIVKRTRGYDVAKPSSETP